jgi:hypothetical protein
MCSEAPRLKPLSVEKSIVGLKRVLKKSDCGL